MGELIKYSNNDPKSRFISEKLLKYLLGQIKIIKSLDKRNELINRIANMSIFPYIGNDGKIYLGSMRENGISWYYLGVESLRQEKSSKNYRIICSDPSVLSREVYNDIISIFGPGAERRGYIQLFSNDVVINAILDEMSLMNDYTSAWWQGAKDIYNLWNRQNNLLFSKACKNIDNNYFMFDSRYCDNKHKDYLIGFNVYNDILKHPLSSDYFSSIPVEDMSSAKELLALLGVPSRFSINGNVDKHIAKIFNGVKVKVKFPCDRNEATPTSRLCDLSQYVVFNVIFNHDMATFQNLINNPDYREGIAIENMNGTFSSISNSLFYGDARENQPMLSGELRNLENLHINSPQINGRNFRNLIASSFNTLNLPFDQYNIGNIRTNAMNFYRWAWRYTDNQQLINNVFNYLSSIRTKYIDSNYHTFVFELLQNARFTELQNYNFSMNVSIQQALTYREHLNTLAHNHFLPRIMVVVGDALTQVNTTKIRYEIMNILDCDEDVRNKIDHADFWRSIYNTLDVKSSSEEYVEVGYIPDGYYDPERIIMISTKNGEELPTILRYICNNYEVRIESVARAKRDWAVDYNEITFGIRSFIDTVINNSTLANTMQESVDLNDIITLKQEKEMWNSLYITRDTLLNSSKEEQRRVDIQKFGWPSFLKEKYKDNCQICGSKIPKGDNESYYKFRIHPERENSFSNIASNLFCLCPKCRGQMQFGVQKRDLRNISRMANSYIVKLLRENSLSSTESIIGSLSSNGNYKNVFKNPIICQIVIDGKQEQIHFSWEHFLRLAFMFYNDDKDYKYEGEIGYLMQLLRMLSESEKMEG